MVSPETTSGLDAPVLVPGTPPLADVHDAVYDVVALPPLAPGVKKTDTDPVVEVAAPGTTFTTVGAPGRASTRTLAEAADGALVPLAFVAVTLQV